MKYGVFLPNFGPFGSARTMANLARAAEESGWDGFFIWDHVSRPHPLDNVDPWVAMAAIAMNTSTLKFGPIVTPLPRRRPWKVARETVSLDHLSGGRLIFGVGIGSSRPSEWEDLGEETDKKVRGAMLDEGLDVLNGLWSGERFTYDGQYYPVQQSHFLPKPVQVPRIPVWVGGEWPNKAPFRRAARWDGVIPLLRADYDPVQQLKDTLSFIHGLREGDQPFDVVHVGLPTPGDDQSQAVEMVAPFIDAGATWWFEPIDPRRFDVDWTDEWPVERLQERVLQGPPKA